MTGTPRRIDVSCLPEDVVELIDTLAPGADLVITRGGEPIATIRSIRPVAEPPAEYGSVTVVATAMRLSATARAALSTELGPDYIVLDLRAAPPTADVVLVPPSSPQLIGSLRRQFPDARIVVTEIDDDELGVSYHGPVRRMLDAGAEAYLASTTVPRLAAQLDHAVNRPRPISGAGGRPELAACATSATPARPPTSHDPSEGHPSVPGTTLTWLSQGS
jgi:antitoxin (DNA-binding transcriptional repressor) of toxin-antitoxin stability system